MCILYTVIKGQDAIRALKATTNDLFAFLTTAPNAEVGAVHPRQCR